MNLLEQYELNHKNWQDPHEEQFRIQAATFFKAKGLPTRQQEDWKYTSLKSLTENHYKVTNSNSTFDSQVIKSAFIAGATNIVFINGLFDENLSQALPNQIKLETWSYKDLTVNFVDSLEALCALYAPQHYKMSVAKEVSLDKPVHLIFWSQGSLALCSTYLNINVEMRSKVEFIETHLGANENYFSNSKIQLNIAESAFASLIKIQEESLESVHIGRTNITAQSSSEIESLCFSTGARIARHTLEVELQGPGINAQINGIYTTVQNQHVDNNTSIDHQSGHCNSSQLYKGLLDGSSRAVFNGKVLIRKNSQKANSEQLNNNLLLSRQAEVDTKPLLEIEADDVKASHGSTVGQMNQEELFYLLSRAIPKTKAISMLSYGYLAEVIDKLKNENTKNLLKKKLAEAFQKISVENL